MSSPTRRPPGRWRHLIAAICAAGLIPTGAQAVDNPDVTGPIAVGSAPGTPAHDYPFFATDLFPPESGYIEQEFFISGKANRYTIPSPALTNATIASTGYPYKARLIVRRPADAAKFNGKVIVEWLNVTAGFENDIEWYTASQYFIRKGYAYVGVGAQRVGVHQAGTGLRAWSPTRYGTLDLTAGGTVTDDSLRWDVFSQAAKAVLEPVGVDPLGWMPGPRTLIAAGHSQSSQMLATYFNTVHPLDPIFPGAVLAGPFGSAIRTDIDTKIIKVISEWDMLQGEGRVRQPDSSVYRAWEVAGASHLSYHKFVTNAAVRVRDVGVTGTLPGTANCIDPARSRVKLHLVHHAAYDWMGRWIAREGTPPSMPAPITVTDFTTSPPTVDRDSFGIARGGIRLPDVTVPTATNTGWNTGGKAPTTDGTCRQAGTSVAFTDAQLRTLYTSHADYVSKVAAAVPALVSAGFILADDADVPVVAAEQSDVIPTARASDGGIRVVEFFSPGPGRYVWTADVAERTNLDFEGGGGGGWFRTGETFFAYPSTGTPPKGAVDVCRLQGVPNVGPSSHFFSANAAECSALVDGGQWMSEGTAFRVPSECLSQDTVHRLWRAGATTPQSRHRFVTNADTAAWAEDAGFTYEGAVFCRLP